LLSNEPNDEECDPPLLKLRRADATDAMKTERTSETFFHWKKLDNRRCHEKLKLGPSINPKNEYFLLPKGRIDNSLAARVDKTYCFRSVVNKKELWI